MSLGTILIGGIILSIYDFIFFQLAARIESKKCNYNCSKCKNWACNKYQCLKYSKNNLKEENEHE